MNAASKTLPAGLAAANADRLDDGQPNEIVRAAADAEPIQTGWDAYDVWRRFIKEAREQRKSERSED